MLRIEKLDRTDIKHTPPAFSRRHILTSLGAWGLSACDERSGVTVPSLEGSGCTVLYSIERIHEGNPMRAYENDFLSERRLADTPENRERARQRVLELREIFGKATAFRQKTLLGLGADKNCGQNTRAFINRRKIDRIRRHSEVVVFSGISETGEPTREQLTRARDDLLREIEKSPKQLSVAFKMHGTEDTIVFGYGESTDTEATPRVNLSPLQLAESLAMRLSTGGLHKYSETEPETIVLETCGSGSYGKKVLKNVQLIRRERGWLEMPVSLVAICSTTRHDIGFANHLTDLLTESPSFQTLYKRESSIGSLTQRSNPEMFVIDPDTYHVTKIV